VMFDVNVGFLDPPPLRGGVALSVGFHGLRDVCDVASPVATARSPFGAFCWSASGFMLGCFGYLLGCFWAVLLVEGWGSS